jgi:hypothetical protein
MAILTALQRGGAFYYTPGLPFLEALLPASTYAITRTPVAFEQIHEFQTDTLYHHLVGQDVNYVTQIRKVAHSETFFL